MRVGAGRRGAWGVGGGEGRVVEGRVLSILSVIVHIDEHASTEIHVSRFG